MLYFFAIGVQNPYNSNQFKNQKVIKCGGKGFAQKRRRLFLEQMRLEVAVQNEIEELTATNSLSLIVAPIFKVKF